MASRFITISIEIMHEENLSPSEKFIIAEIEQLSTLKKGCIAENKHFTRLIGISLPTVSRAISSLKNKGYISVITKAGSRNHKRTMTVIHDFYGSPALKPKPKPKQENKMVKIKEQVLEKYNVSAPSLDKLLQHRKKLGYEIKSNQPVIIDNLLDNMMDSTTNKKFDGLDAVIEFYCKKSWRGYEDLWVKVSKSQKTNQDINSFGNALL